MHNAQLNRHWGVLLSSLSRKSAITTEDPWNLSEGRCEKIRPLGYAAPPDWGHQYGSTKPNQGKSFFILR